jgi:hypothetical protein
LVSCKMRKWSIAYDAEIEQTSEEGKRRP